MKKEAAEKEPAGRRRRTAAGAADGFGQKEKEALAMLAMSVKTDGWDIEYVPLPYGACRRRRLSPAGERRDGGWKSSDAGIVAGSAPAAVREADSVYGPEGWKLLKARLDAEMQKHAGEWAAEREPSAEGSWVCPKEEAELDWEKWKIRRNFAELHLKNGDFLRDRKEAPERRPEKALRSIRTEAAALKAAQADGRSLEFIDPAFRTPKVCAAAIGSCAQAAAFVPPQARSAVERMLAASVRSNPGSLRFMPDEFRTPAVCAQAVAAGGSAVIEHVPAGGQEAARALVFMEEAFDDRWTTSDRQNACRRLRLKLDQALAACPEWRAELQDAAMRLMRYGTDIAAVPPAMQSNAMRLAAVRDDAAAFGFIPDAFKTEAVCLAAVRGGAPLQDVPERLRTEEVCGIAVRRRPSDLAWTPESFQTEKRCIACIARIDPDDAPALSIVSPAKRTPAVCLAALERDPGSWRFVPPEAAADERLWIGAVQRLGFGLDSVPEQMATAAVCLAAAGKNPAELSKVPEGMLTERICLAAVEQDGMALELVPEAMRTEAVCAAAERQNPQAAAFFPEADGGMHPGA